MRKNGSVKYFYATDVDTREADDEHSTLLQKEEEIAQKQFCLVKKIITDNNTKLRKIENDYQKINNIYDQMSVIMVEQTEQIHRVEGQLGDAQGYVEKGNEELVTNYENSSNNSFGLMVKFLIVLTIIFVLFVLIQDIRWFK